MSGFKAETETGVKSAFQGIGKIIGAAVAFGGVAEIGKSIVDAATEHQAAFDVLDRTIKNAGASTKVAGQEIESLLEKEARLKGFSDEELASSFVRLVSATGNSTKAYKDLGLAEDLARARHIDLATAALALSKAEQGSFTSLQRYGIIVHSASTETDKLKAAHDRAVASGATFTAQQKQEYAAALATAKANDGLAKSVAAIQLVQSRFGGTANTFADTASGQIARLRQDFHQLEVQAGTPLLAGIAGGAEGLGELITKLVEGQRVGKAFAAGEKEITAGLHDVKAVAETVGPPLLAIVSAGAKVVETIGAGPIIAAAAAYKGLQIVLVTVSRAEAFYASTAALGAKADKAVAAAKVGVTETTTAATAATGASATATATAARSSQIAAAASIEEAAGIKAVAASASGLLVPLGALIAETDALAVSEQAVAVASTEAAAGGVSNFGRGLLALGSKGAGGPIGLAVIGVAALAGGITYLASKESDWDSANKRLSSSVGALSDALAKQKEALGPVARATAGQDVAAARAATTAAVSHSASVAQHEELVATNNLKRGIELKYTAEQRAAAATAIHAGAVNDFVHAIGEQIIGLGKQNPLLSHNLDLVGELARRIKEVPSQHEIDLLINNKDPKAGIVDVLTGLSQIEQFIIGIGKAASAPSPSSGVFPSILKGVQEAAAAESAQEVQKDKLVASLQKQFASITAAGDAALATQRQDLAQQEQQGRQQVTDAVASAQQNLVSIGQAISSSVQAVIDKPFQTAVDNITLAQDKIAARYDRLAAQLAPEQARLNRENATAQLASDKLNLSRLRQGVLLPGGKELSADPKTALAELNRLANSSKTVSTAAVKAFILQYSAAFRAIESDQLGLKTTAISNARTAKETGLQLRSDDLRVATDHANLVKTAVARRLNDLTTLFDQHRIKFSTLIKDVDKLLEKNGVSVKTAGKLLGPAFAAQFQGQLTGLGQQAAAIGAGPQRPGIGLLPTIQRPEQVLKQVLLQNHRSEQELTRAQLEQQKKQTTLLTKIHNAQAGTKFTNSLERNPGRQSKTNAALTRTTG